MNSYIKQWLEIIENMNNDNGEELLLNYVLKQIN